jgi:hypothetical protein
LLLTLTVALFEGGLGCTEGPVSSQMPRIFGGGVMVQKAKEHPERAYEFIKVKYVVLL